MTEGVEKVPLSAVEETNTSKSKETDEVDLDDFSDSNFVVTGSEQAEEVEISFSNIQRESGITAEQIREELKNLKNKPIEEVTIEIDGKKGRIALEDINIGESSDTPTYHEGSISGTFLPWPKHFTNNRPKIYTFLNGSTVSVFSSTGNLLFSIELEANFASKLFVDGDASRITGLDVNVTGKNVHYNPTKGYGTNYSSDYSLSNVHLSYILSLISDSSFTLDLPTALSLVISLDGSSSYSLTSTSDLSLLHSVSSSLNHTLSSSSSLSSLVVTSGSYIYAGSLTGSLKTNVVLSGDSYYNWGYSSKYGDDYGDEVLSDLILLQKFSSQLNFSHSISSELSKNISISKKLLLVSSIEASLSSLVYSNGSFDLNSSVSSNLLELVVLTLSANYKGSLSAAVSRERGVKGLLSSENKLISDISLLSSLSSNLNNTNILSGNLEFSTVAYGSKYGTDYGSPSTVIYGEQYGTEYGSPTEYSAGYGSDYGS